MTPAALRLVVRTPTGVVLDVDEVLHVLAEDQDGWFGILPGRAELVAVMPAGLLVYRDRGGREGFVAHAPAVLHHRRGACRVLASEASVAARIEDVAEVARRHTVSRAQQDARRDDAVGLLARELQRRLLEVRP